MCVLGYIGILYHNEHSPEVRHIPPGTPCICIHTHTHTHTWVKEGWVDVNSTYYKYTTCVIVYEQEVGKKWRLHTSWKIIFSWKICGPSVGCLHMVPQIFGPAYVG